MLHATFQSHCLLSQHIGPKPLEGILYPVPAFPIRTNLLSRPERSGHETRLSTKEDPSQAKQRVRCEVADPAGFYERCQVGQRLFATVREANCLRLLGELEGAEHALTSGADAEGEEGAQREADDRAYEGMRAYGGGGALESISVGFRQAVVVLLAVTVLFGAACCSGLCRTHSSFMCFSANAFKSGPRPFRNMASESDDIAAGGSSVRGAQTCV